MLSHYPSPVTVSAAAYASGAAMMMSAAAVTLPWSLDLWVLSPSALAAVLYAVSDCCCAVRCESDERSSERCCFFVDFDGGFFLHYRSCALPYAMNERSWMVVS